MQELQEVSRELIAVIKAEEERKKIVQEQMQTVQEVEATQSESAQETAMDSPLQSEVQKCDIVLIKKIKIPCSITKIL